MKNLSIVTVVFVMLLSFVSCKNQEPTPHKRIITHGDYRFELLSDPNSWNKDMDVLVTNTKKQAFHFMSEFEADITTQDSQPGVYGNICTSDFNLPDTCQKVIRLHQTSKLTIYPDRIYTEDEVKTMSALGTDNGIVMFESAEKFFDIY
jgi:hypothetical protein